MENGIRKDWMEESRDDDVRVFSVVYNRIPLCSIPKEVLNSQDFIILEMALLKI